MDIYDLTDKEAWLQNDNLYSGSKIYLLAQSISFNRDSNITFSPTSKVDVFQSGETVGDSTNLNRRKGHNTYNGVGPLTINISGIMDLNNLDGLDDGTITVTPGILHTWILNGYRQFNYFDGKISRAWEQDPHADTQTPYGSANGIPVVLTSWNVDMGQSENIMTYSLELREDRD